MKSSAPRYHARRRRSTLRSRLPPASPRPAVGSPCPPGRTGDVLADFGDIGAQADEHARVRRRDGDRQADDRVDLRHRILPRQGASAIPARRNLVNPVQRVARRPALTDGDASMAQRVDARRLAGEGGGEPVAAGRPQSPRNGGDRFRIAREIERRRRSARRAAKPVSGVLDTTRRARNGTRQERDETGGSGRIDAGDRPGKPPSGVTARPVRQGSRRSGIRSARRIRQTPSCERVKKLDGPHYEGRFAEVLTL